MLSVVIPTYNRNQNLDNCLKSITNCSKNCEILVPHPEIDKELSEICIKYGALEYLDGSRKNGKRIRSIWGVINDGIQKASNNYVAWINDDCLVLPNWDEIGESYFIDSVGLVIFKTKGINMSQEYRTIEAAFGIPCANYAILNKKIGVRFDESYSWFYGDADISLQVALKKKLSVIATKENCIDHLHCVDTERKKNETDPRIKSDELYFRKKWRTYTRIGTNIINLHIPILARMAKKISRMFNEK